ncbi:Feruloyl esterase B [Cytospora mali]|uniref:feruloyl esterase n=1 Tax=Cytospora mali TaxID=578113 RepID=A0A194VKY8_CYTMA|nr:Feruloyl esterase B [Valsa mali]
MSASKYIIPLFASLLGYGLAAKSSAGCQSFHEVEVKKTYNVTLAERQYLLWFPGNYEPTEPAPLILSYHGGSRTAEEQYQLDLLTTTYFNTDYIVVYPSGINETWQGVPGVTTDDIGFTSSILDELEARYCIDTDRIFATGKSQGGGFVGVLACDEALSRRIAAFSPVSGAFYISDYGDVCDPETVSVEPCNPGRDDIPILNFHGKADKTIKYDGGTRRGACLPAIPHWVQTWAERDGLGLDNETSNLPLAAEDSTAVRYEFGNGTARGLVTHVMDGKNIGHDWPSTQANSDNLESGHHLASFNASSLIIDFFNAHPLSRG